MLSALKLIKNSRTKSSSILTARASLTTKAKLIFFKNYISDSGKVFPLFQSLSVGKKLDATLRNIKVFIKAMIKIMLHHIKSHDFILIAFNPHLVYQFLFIFKGQLFLQSCFNWCCFLSLLLPIPVVNSLVVLICVVVVFKSIICSSEAN